MGTFFYTIFYNKISASIANIFNIINTFIGLKIFEDLFNTFGIQYILQEGNTGGIRITIIKRSLEYLFSRPLLGSLYRSPSNIFETSDININSYHLQYLDILMRPGIFVGTAVLILIIYLLFISYKSNKDLNLFFPFLSIFIYGFFHETFRESQGAFIFYNLTIILISYNLIAKKILFKRG